MLLLCFETSAKAGSVALFDENQLLGESYQLTALTHSQTLMVMAQDLIKQCQRTPGDITHVAVAAGPGSFTGVRIGVAAAKGFAWGKELPCYGVSTLEAMALGLGLHDGYICAAMDARRSQVYNALFKAENGVLTRICEDRAISLADLGEELARLEGPIHLVGDGAALCHKSFPATILPPQWRQHQRAVGVGLAALKKIAAGEPGDGAALTPNYLRLSQAERERLERGLSLK
ncbi:MAG: tRNA (adenosine(37)-N6)-threonylcarbamoyltransferase complex dimerization subunit type 1 TsaB [Oscillospiraceae bacterium]|nr:tRNA (adenosine(37)-N6)-threonylcarbamoyltransferase complex dimerization subunit type 1 TsaB [Oscillospiraceae bacterium]